MPLPEIEGNQHSQPCTRCCADKFVPIRVRFWQCLDGPLTQLLANRDVRIWTLRCLVAGVTGCSLNFDVPGSAAGILTKGSGANDVVGFPGDPEINRSFGTWLMLLTAVVAEPTPEEAAEEAGGDSEAGLSVPTGATQPALPSLPFGSADHNGRSRPSDDSREELPAQNSWAPPEVPVPALPPPMQTPVPSQPLVRDEVPARAIASPPAVPVAQTPGNSAGSVLERADAEPFTYAELGSFPHQATSEAGIPGRRQMGDTWAFGLRLTPEAADGATNIPERPPAPQPDMQASLRPHAAPEPAEAFRTDTLRTNAEPTAETLAASQVPELRDNLNTLNHGHPREDAPVEELRELTPETPRPSVPPADQPPPQIPAHAPSAATGTRSPRTDPAEPMVRVEVGTPPPANSAPTPARHLAVRLHPQGADPVDVHVAERHGEVRVEVRTADGDLRGALRQDLNTLVERLGSSGFHAEALPDPQEAQTRDSLLPEIAPASWEARTREPLAAGSTFAQGNEWHSGDSQPHSGGQGGRHPHPRRQPHTFPHNFEEETTEASE